MRSAVETPVANTSREPTIVVNQSNLIVTHQPRYGLLVLHFSRLPPSKVLMAIRTYLGV